MKDEFQAEKEVSIIEILKALFSKILYLLLALVLGAIAGGAYGYMTSKDVRYYGTNLTFYVNPSAKEGAVESESIYSTYGSYSVNVMTNIVTLLDSEIVASEMVDGMIAKQVDGLKGVQKYASDGVTLTGAYKNWLSIVSSAVSFSYKGEGNIAESFIHVKISINSDVNGGKGDKVAEEISKQVQETVPAFVEQNMPRPTGYNATNCTLTKMITDIKLTNASYASTQMTKLALIAGAVAFVIAAAVVIILYMSDKRLMDIDVLPTTFKLPILGVIPSIDEEDIHHSDDKGGKA